MMAQPRRWAAICVVLLAGGVSAWVPSKCDNQINYKGKVYSSQNISDLVDGMFDKVAAAYGNWTNMTAATEEYKLKHEKTQDTLNMIREELNVTQSKVQGILNTVNDYQMTVNVIAVLAGSLFVYLGKFGYLARHVGMVTVKNVKLTAVQEVLGTACGTLGWWAIGFGVAYGIDSFSDSIDDCGLCGFVGYNGYFGDISSTQIGMEMSASREPRNAYKHAQFLLQMGYCLVAVGIPIGSLAERSTVVFTVFMSLLVSVLVYPVLVHSFWDVQGYFSAFRDKELLFDCGVIDYAGSGVIHLCGGATALSGSLIIGARSMRWKTDEDSVKPVIQPKPQASPAFEAFGALLLFTCSIANTGFATKYFVEDSVIAGKAMVNTMIASGISSIASVCIGHFYTGVVSPQLACGGLIAGVAAISSGCAVMEAEGALVTGFCAAWAYYVGGALMIKLRLDDVSHAISMHGFAGGFGLIATGLFADKDAYEAAYSPNRIDACYGVFYNGGIAQLAAQAMGLAFVIAWVGFITTVMFAIFHMVTGTRYPTQWEENGIDYHKFGGQTQYAHVAVQKDHNRYAHGILNYTNYGNKETEKQD